jgi:hypothetical protein
MYLLEKTAIFVFGVVIILSCLSAEGFTFSTLSENDYEDSLVIGGEYNKSEGYTLFDYPLENNTLLEWNLITEEYGEFDFLIFWDAENPFSDTFFEVYGVNETSGSKTINKSICQWYYCIRNSTSNSVYVTGWINQTGTPVDATTTTSTTIITNTTTTIESTTTSTTQTTTTITSPSSTAPHDIKPSPSPTPFDPNNPEFLIFLFISVIGIGIIAIFFNERKNPSPSKKRETSKQ